MIGRKSLYKKYKTKHSPPPCYLDYSPIKPSHPGNKRVHHHEYSHSSLSPLLLLQTPSNAGFHPANSRPLWIVNPMALPISYFMPSFLIHGSIFLIQNVRVPYTYHAVIPFWSDSHELYFLFISKLIPLLFVFRVTCSEDLTSHKEKSGPCPWLQGSDL